MSAIIGIPGLLLSVAVKATLLLALAAVLDRAVLRRRASADARHLVWIFAIGTLLLLPVLAWATPDWGPRLSVGAAETMEAAFPAPTEVPAEAAARSDDAAVGQSAPIQAAAPASSTEPAPAPAEGGARDAVASSLASVLVPLMLAAYLAGVLLLLLKVVVEQSAVVRLSRSATPIRDGGWGALLHSIGESLGVRRRVDLLRHAGPTIPLTWGVIRPAVLLPADADEWTESRRRAVLLHEMAHIRRHDCLTQTLAAVACALYWPHPGVWWAAARLRAERELACDDQALAHGVRPREYAGHLLELARGRQAPRALSTLVVSMATRTHLEARLKAVIDDTRVREPVGRRARVLAAACTALLLVPLAAVRAGAADRSPPVEQPSGGAGRASLPPTPLPAVPAVSAAGATVLDAPLQQDGGTWVIRRASRADAPSGVPSAHVMLRTRGINTFVVPISRLQGLTPDRIGSSDGAATFALRHDAGTLAFRGEFRGGRGTGTFAFTAAPAFTAELARRGIDRPDARQVFSLGIHGFSFALLDELAAQGYATPTARDLVSLAMSGVDLEYLRGMGALGYRMGTVPAIIGLSNHSVSPAYVRELSALGYRGLPARDLVHLRNHSLDPEAIRGLNARAGRTLSVAELVGTRMDGERTAAAAPAPSAAASFAADAPAASEAARSSSTPLSGSWVTRGTREGAVYLRLNWSDGSNWDRWMPISALSGTSAAEVAAASSRVAFRIEQDAGTFEMDGSFQSGRGSGGFRFRPNRAFGRTLLSLGVSGAGSPSDHDLKNLAWGGISATAVRELTAAGLSPLTMDDLLGMAIFHVTPGFVRELRALRISDPLSPRLVTDLRHSGVSETYVRELAALGYRGISADQLERLWRRRVTPEFIRSARQDGQPAPSPEALIEMKDRERDAARERTRAAARRG